MANPEHVKWLKEGVTAWNARRERDDFTPDLQGAHLQSAQLLGADLQGADLRGADLWDADLRKANLQGADLQGADLWGANLRAADLQDANLQGADLQGAFLQDANLHGANLHGADAMTLKSLAGQTGAASDFIITDFTHSHHLTQEQVDGMRGTKGAHGTLLPDGLSAPDHWETIEELYPEFHEDTDLDIDNDVRPRTIYVTRNLPPAELIETAYEKLNIKLDPISPTQREGTNTPINKEQRDQLIAGLIDSVRMLYKNLGNYTTEDVTTSNRATLASQFRSTLSDLELQLMRGGDVMVPTTVEDIINGMDYAYADASLAFESIDTGLTNAVIDRSRDLLRYYEDILAEIKDPHHVNLIPDNFPISAQDLVDQVTALVNSDEGRDVFTDETRNLVEHEANVIKSPQDGDKKTQARFGALVGEMVRKLNGAAEKSANWSSVLEQAKHIWDMIKPFLGT